MTHSQTGRVENHYGIQEVTTLYSFSWLFVANLVGLLLAVLLVWPGLNDWLSPFSYGRWVPLHMDWQLYGWCSLPLLGLFHARYLADSSGSVALARVSFMLWSVSLFLGGATWLAGGSTGKLFLNWAGPAGLIYGATLLAIWLILASSWIMDCRSVRSLDAGSLQTLAKGLLLLGLLAVPFVLIYTSDPGVYPPVNPDSGGATGHSLLASTLSLVFLMGLLPGQAMMLEKRDSRYANATGRIFWIAFLLSVGVYLFIHHGNASNHELNQVFGLGTLLLWPVLVGIHWEQYLWSAGSAKWRWAFLAWWGFLALDGWLLFLPGILDLLKFTNALVGHSHLAMAGMLSSLNMTILLHLGKSNKVRQAASNNLAFWLWNCGCLVYVATMTLQGVREGIDPGVLFARDLYTSINYTVRLLAGIAMLGASAFWISGTFGYREKPAGQA